MSVWGSSNFSEFQIVRKPATRSTGGIVAAQHSVAARVGAEILSDGGDAVDAAVAISFALGVVEPWMSGPLGGGMMTVWRRESGTVSCVEFGMRAPRGLDPRAYPLDSDRERTRLSAWPAVVGDRNVYGAPALGVPGVVAGMDVAHSTWGRMTWAELVSPAVELARDGLRLDWFSSSLIAFAARSLAADPDAARLFLTDGQWPNIGGWIEGAETRLDQGRMADALDRIATAGAADFYSGDLARSIVSDVTAKGGCMDLEDLLEYRPVRREPLSFDYRDARLHVPQGLCAGPDLKVTLDRVAAALPVSPESAPALLAALGDALVGAQKDRLDSAGHAAEHSPTSTTAFCVIDGDGNAVSVTQTLLSIFGAHCVGSTTGLLMNNAIMWFDPRPGRPNSLMPNADCLMNICPVIGETPRGRFALGASGGRKILSCVANLVSCIVDRRMCLEEAFAAARIDASLGHTIVADERLTDELLDELMGRGHVVRRARRGPHPYAFGVPAGAFDTGQERFGCTEVHSPYGDAIATQRA